MAKKLSFAQQYQQEQEAKYARIAAQAKIDAEAQYQKAKAEQDAFEAVQAARLAALTPEQRAAEEAEKIARWNANHQIETFNARRAPVAPPAYPIKPVDLFGEPE